MAGCSSVVSLQRCRERALCGVQGALAQARRALKPDGLLLAAMLGGETLQELRIACSLAEQEREGGVSSRVSPLAQVRDPPVYPGSKF